MDFIYVTIQDTYTHIKKKKHYTECFVVCVGCDDCCVNVNCAYDRYVWRYAIILCLALNMLACSLAKPKRLLGLQQHFNSRRYCHCFFNRRSINSKMLISIRNFGQIINLNFSNEIFIASIVN